VCSPGPASPGPRCALALRGHLEVVTGFLYTPGPERARRSARLLPDGPHTTLGHSNTSPVARSGPERISPTPGTGRDLGGERRVLHVFWLSPRPARYGYRQVSENDGWRVFGLLPVSHGRGPPLTVFVARLEVSAGLTRGATQQRVVELFSPNLTTVQFLLRLPSPSAALALLCRPSARTLQSYSAQRVTVR
jgi:hypothetical protein